MEIDKIYNMDCLEGMKQMESDSVDAIISDPPYQLTSITKARPDQTAEGEYGKETPFSRPQSRIKGFMNKEWDILPSVEILKECLRVLKPGAWALWLMTPRQDSQLEFLLRLRQAGFNIAFSSVEWVYASGFPKAADLSLLADKKACKEDIMQKLGREPTKDEFKEAWGKWREVIGEKIAPDGIPYSKRMKEEHHICFSNAGDRTIAISKTNPHSLKAQALNGSYAGMQLKPARELIIVSQKPIAGKTYLDQALLYLKEPDHNQLGGTWLDDGRIPYQSESDRNDAKPGGKITGGIQRFSTGEQMQNLNLIADTTKGRFPANLLVSDNVIDIGLDKKSSKVNSIGGFGAGVNTFGAGVNTFGEGIVNYERGYEDSGDLSRYFDLDFWFENKLKQLPKEQQKIFPFLYVPKASKNERNSGLEGLGEKENPQANYGLHSPKGLINHGRNPENYSYKTKNIHPTVKPIKLMSYLISLATREGDIVLDPFMGSGTTAIASILLNRKFIGFEREKEYYDIANNRLKKYMEQNEGIKKDHCCWCENCEEDAPHETKLCQRHSLYDDIREEIGEAYFTNEMVESLESIPIQLLPKIEPKYIDIIKKRLNWGNSLNPEIEWEFKETN